MNSATVELGAQYKYISKMSLIPCFKNPIQLSSYRVPKNCAAEVAQMRCWYYVIKGMNRKTCLARSVCAREGCAGWPESRAPCGTYDVVALGAQHILASGMKT